jgi:DNA gyrase subunit A
VPGPDFPTGRADRGAGGDPQAYETGRGRVVMRARSAGDSARRAEQLVVTEIPYATSKTRIIEQIADLVKRGKVPDISDLRDESDRDGIRLVIELKRGADAPKVVAGAAEVDGAAVHLRRDQPGAGRRCAARVHAEGDAGALPRPPDRGDRAPLALGAGSAREEAHVLEGLLVALKNIDEVVRSSAARGSGRRRREAAQASSS